MPNNNFSSSQDAGVTGAAKFVTSTLLEELAAPSQVQPEAQESLLEMRWEVSGRALKMRRTELQRELKMLGNGGNQQWIAL
ncbi:hypothetical protein KXW12_001221 [Aspergillus fumigatus]|nr:hypothetical protein KXX51_007119 [Aspergillus fumigatus]KAH1692136.1 hypothetical protein KXX23_002164 [Aspergillus fumigatus]KAH1900082.1 hypothetical protein KXW69_001381 [Aspergillus fumigatus]KAH1931853.1 hypothetical protein KXV48_008250 [Aspergillus fumigatus]KAH1950687.1 hypothetical protein KXV90_001548 [Aspergillus fumigatus]